MEIHFVRGETYRPHLPFPIYYRVVGYGDVELVSAPSIPEGTGESLSIVIKEVASSLAGTTSSFPISLQANPGEAE
jgi:hypothetical protein